MQAEPALQAVVWCQNAAELGLKCLYHMVSMSSAAALQVPPVTEGPAGCPQVFHRDYRHYKYYGERLQLAQDANVAAEAFS